MISYRANIDTLLVFLLVKHTDRKLPGCNGVGYENDQMRLKNEKSEN